MKLFLHFLQLRTFLYFPERLISISFCFLLFHPEAANPSKLRASYPQSRFTAPHPHIYCLSIVYLGWHNRNFLSLQTNGPRFAPL